jgi:hypothetical protein
MNFTSATSLQQRMAIRAICSAAAARVDLSKESIVIRDVYVNDQENFSLNGNFIN